MKYRIIKDDQGYRVQRKILWFWFYYWDYVANDEEMMMEWVHKRFVSEKDAIQFIYEKKRKRTKTVVVFEL